jgi:hypothetical protein
MVVLATFMLLFLIGYSSQRSGVCMVRATRELIERQRVNRLAGFLLAAALAMIAMALADLLGARPFITIAGSRPDMLAIAGGALFGLGTLLAGNCAIGTLAALTTGETHRIATIAAMFLAALLLGPSMSQAALMLPPRVPLVSPVAGHTLQALLIGGALAVLAGGYIYRRLGWSRPRGGWSPLVAMSLIGAASGTLFALDQRWVYTSRIAEVAYGEVALSWATIIGPLALIGGMVIAAIVGGTFRLQFGGMRAWITAVGGGLLMGLGATLVPGGNDAMLFTGVPLLLPNLLAAYATFFVTLLIGLKVRQAMADKAERAA